MGRSPFYRNGALTGPVCQGSMIGVRVNAASTLAGTSAGTEEEEEDPRTVLLYTAPASLEARDDGYVRASFDGGRSWWLTSKRIDDPAYPGFGYSGIIETTAVVTAAAAKLQKGAWAASNTTFTGVVYEPGGGGDGVAYLPLALDLASPPSLDYS
jgi:hypothetical protein